VPSWAAVSWATVEHCLALKVTSPSYFFPQQLSPAIAAAIAAAIAGDLELWLGVRTPCAPVETAAGPAVAGGLVHAGTAPRLPRRAAPHQAFESDSAAPFAQATTREWRKHQTTSLTRWWRHPFPVLQDGCSTPHGRMHATSSVVGGQPHRWSAMTHDASTSAAASA
jgi:hypothetical protein